MNHAWLSLPQSKAELRFEPRTRDPVLYFSHSITFALQVNLALGNNKGRSGGQYPSLQMASFRYKSMFGVVVLGTRWKHIPIGNGHEATA